MKMRSRQTRIENAKWPTWVFVLVIYFLVQGCTTTDSGTTQVTGQLRNPVDPSSVDIYQNPAGLIDWIPDMEIPTAFEQIATMELSDTASNNQRQAIDNITYNLVYSLQRRAAKMGANGIVIREVKVSEDVVEEQSSPYRTVRYPDGSIGEVEVPVTVSYRRVLKVTVVADSVFLDWNNA